MKLGVAIREKLAAISESIPRALDSLIGAIVGAWSVEHNPVNDTHTNIHADSVTVTKDAGRGTSGSVTIGGNITVAGLARINANIANLPPYVTNFSASPVLNTLLHIVQADAMSARALLDSFGNSGQLNFRSTNGTISAPTALLANGIIGNIGGAGYGATGYNVGHRIRLDMSAAENWTDAAQGTYFRVNTTPAGTVNLTERMRVKDGLMVGTTTDAGAGTVNAVTGYFERARTTALGEWIAVAFAAGNFTASAGNWTLTAPDQVSFKYTLIGKTMVVSVAFTNTTVTAGPVTLSVIIPGGFTAASIARSMINVQDAGAAFAIGMMEVQAGATTISFFKDPTAAAWAAGVNNTAVIGELTFEIQ